MRSVSVFVYPVFVVTAMLCNPGKVLADSFFDQFIDPKDGKLDTSQWLAGRTGFLPAATSMPGCTCPQHLLRRRRPDG